MLYDLSDPRSLVRFDTRVASLRGAGKFVELTERRPLRSGRQNRYLHASIRYFALQSGYSVADVKEFFFKGASPSIFVVTVTDRFTGAIRSRLRSSASLDTAEMTLAIERFRDWSSRIAGIYLPSPDDERALRYMESEIAANPDIPDF